MDRRCGRSALIPNNKGRERQNAAVLATLEKVKLTTAREVEALRRDSSLRLGSIRGLNSGRILSNLMRELPQGFHLFLLPLPLLLLPLPLPLLLLPLPLPLPLPLFVLPLPLPLPLFVLFVLLLVLFVLLFDLHDLPDGLTTFFVVQLDDGGLPLAWAGGNIFGNPATIERPPISEAPLRSLRRLRSFIIDSYVATHGERTKCQGSPAASNSGCAYIDGLLSRLGDIVRKRNIRCQGYNVTKAVGFLRSIAGV